MGKAADPRHRRRQGGALQVVFEPALLPARTEACAEIRQGRSVTRYRSHWTEAGTRTLLEDWRVGGRQLLAGLGPTTAGGRAWLTDLHVQRCPSLVAVRAHGDDRGQPLVVQTTWFLHLADLPDEIWCQQTFESRRSRLTWKVWGPARGLRVEGPGLTTRRTAYGLRLKAAAEGEQWSFRLATPRAKPWQVDVEVLPPENDRGYVDPRLPFTLTVNLTNRSSLALTGAHLRVYGLGRAPDVPVSLPPVGSQRVSIPVRPGNARGIVPLAVRFEHPQAVGLGMRTLWIPRVVVASDQPWLDGMVAENLRSAVHRFTFNTWREDEPRYPYYNGVFNRNILSALIALDNPRRLWGWIRLWFMALRSCGFMPEALGMVIPPLRDESWLERRLAVGNDGTGFTLIQWGKLFLRADDTLRREMLREDMADLLRVARLLQRDMHWNGQIEDHSEPVEGIRTARFLAGSPYAQTLCLAGALLVRRALTVAERYPGSASRQELCALYADLARRLRAGLELAIDEQGRFLDITSDQNQEHPHTYTNLAAGMFLTDPDLGPDAWSNRQVLEQTLEANVAYHAPGRPYRVLTCPYWPPHPGLSHNAYSQIAAIVNCLAVNREKDAGHYLEELIDGTQADCTRYMGSDPKFTIREWPVADRGFARYIIPEGRVPGHDAVKLNPGNGVNVSYFLYLVDRMIGITPREEYVEIAPHPANLRQWEVADYPTRLGPVSYRLEREGGRVRFRVTTAGPAAVRLPTAGAAALYVDGGAYPPDTGSVAGAWVRLPAGTHELEAGPAVT